MTSEDRDSQILLIPTLPTLGDYNVFVSYVPGATHASNAFVRVRSLSDEPDMTDVTLVQVNQRQAPAADGFVTICTYRFNAESGLEGIGFLNEARFDANTTERTDGHFIVDAVRFEFAEC